MNKILYKLEDIKYHFKNNFSYYLLIAIFALVGIAVGVYIALERYSYISLLNMSDKNMISYISGTANYSSIFYSHLLDILLAFSIVVLLSLNKYTCILGNIFLSYQMALIVLYVASIISLYGIAGILNCIFLILPINLANFCVLSFALGVGHERAKLQSDYKIKFGASFRENDYIFKIGLSFLTLIILCVINSFILPLFIKSFVVVNF